MDIHPIILTGRYVRLVPLSLDHTAELAAAGNEPDIWRYMPYGNVDSPEKMRGWIEGRLRLQTKGTDLPFAIIHLATGRAIGATRYLTIDHPNRSLEIGGSWLHRDYRRSAANTESKYLLLRHAFETLGALRVQLRTDLRNERSQQAIERLGAAREAVFRKYTIMPDGYQRSSVFYSITDDEWPGVKARLEEWL
ncbi:MAG: GNAT family N-acetyltransferase [Chloroflexi bacterium]|nr:GNAT family N-acetyltransferase [Chloroflexota bacterium]MBI5293588.1 GNAT family N-acetyltransferase [Chloroflexota bacterium]